MRLLLAACIGLVSLGGCEPGKSPVNPPPSSGATAAPPAIDVFRADSRVNRDGW